MPKFRIPGFHHRSQSPENQKSDIFPNESVSSDDIEGAENDRVQNLTNLMTVSKNPSTVFKPPFGTSAEEHHSRLGEHAQHLWRYNKITDLNVKLRETQYPCHKTVLSCYSKYFKELLLDQKGTVSVVHLKLPSVTNTAFEVLLTYMYTSELNLTCQNIGEVYTASRKLGVDGALILCTKILNGKSKNDVHSVYVYVTAKKQGLDDCAAKALKLMARRFEQIVGTPEYLDLDFSQVKEYLSQDCLATRSEVVVYLAALKWLSVKFLEREEYAADLLRCVRFQMMTLNEVLACFSPPLLPGILEQKIISDRLLAATCYVAAVTVNEERRFERYSCTPRKYLLKREPIILWDTSIFDADRHAMYVQEMAATTIQAAYRGFQTRKSIAADLESGVLRRPEVDPMLAEDAVDSLEDEDDVAYVASKSVSGSVASVFDNIRKSVVSFIGVGKEKKEKSEEEILHKEKDGESEEDPEINSLPSKSSSTDTLIGHVNDLAENTELKKYVSDTAVDMSSEAFLQSFPRPKHETVHKVYTRPSLEDYKNKESDGSKSFSSVSDEIQISNENIAGYILLTGGFKSEDSEDDFECKAMFLYDTSRDEWRRYGSMLKARHHHCLIYLNEEIYFIGGCNPHKTTAGRMVPEKSCYKLDLESREWSKISKMHHSRMYHAVVELGGKIFVIGGKDDKDRLLSSIEIYNPKSNKWEEMETPLETPTMGLGACVHQGNLWVVGGMIQDEEGAMSLLSDVMIYVPDKKKWSEVRQLPFPRAFSTVVSFENDVYVIGGTSQLDEAQEEELTSVLDVLFYDTKKKEWTSTTELPFPRHFVEASVVGNNLYVLGGLTSYERNAVDEVLMYNKKTYSWRSCTPLPEPVCGFAATFISQVPSQQ